MLAAAVAPERLMWVFYRAGRRRPARAVYGWTVSAYSRSNSPEAL